MISSLDAWLDRITRLHARAIDLDLGRVHPVAERLGVTSLSCAVITVGGTNGKGSSVAMLEAVLRAGGFRVGAYTSPHLLRYPERVRLDGIEVSDAALCDAFERVDVARAGTSLSYFEFGTLAALDLFRRAAPDVVILEVGLGGRLDAVNVVDPDVALITSVGVDHTDWLGCDRESIGREKAGIFRPGRPAICGDANPPASLLEAAHRLDAPLWLRGRDFDVRPAPGGGASWRAPCGRWAPLPTLSLPGDHQVGNAAAALAALMALESRLPGAASGAAEGLPRAWVAGRFQRLEGQVPVYLDVAHNPDSARTLVRLLEPGRAGTGRTLAVFGALRDKDLATIAGIMGPAISAWHVAAPAAERAAPVAMLAAAVMSGCGATAEAHGSLVEALSAARRSAGPDDRVVVFGSFLAVSEILAVQKKGGAG